jgi:hypothetical protein
MMRIKREGSFELGAVSLELQVNSFQHAVLAFFGRLFFVL